MLGTQQEKCPVSGNVAELQQGLAIMRKQNPTGLGLMGARSQGPPLAQSVVHPELGETIPCASCLPR